MVTAARIVLILLALTLLFIVPSITRLSGSIGIIPGLWTLIIILYVPYAVIGVWAIAEISRRNQPATWKLKWAIIILVLHLLGLLLYLFIARKKTDEEDQWQRMTSRYSNRTAKGRSNTATVRARP